MKSFEHFNKKADPCPVCGTHKDKPCTLIPIDGTEDGGNVRCEAVHVGCIELRYNQLLGVFYQKLVVNNGK